MQAVSKIVVGVDFSEQGELALEAARVLASEAGATLHLVNAVETPLILNPYTTTLPADFVGGIREAAREQLESLAGRLKGVPVETHLRGVPAAEAIRTLAEEIEADLVVVGTHGRQGLRRFFLGSVAERVARLSPCSVLTVRPGGADGDRPRYVVATDFSPSANRAVVVATELATQRGAELDVDHAFHAPFLLVPYGVKVPADVIDAARAAAAQLLDAEAENIGAQGIKPSLRLVEGPPASAITEHAERVGAELLVLGTHGHSGLAHLALGSVAAETLRRATCSVLTVKLPGGE